MQTSQSAITVMLLIMAVAILLTISLAIRLSELSRKLSNYDMEISRTEGEERKLWIRRKRRFLLSLLPFYGLFHKRRS